MFRNFVKSVGLAAWVLHKRFSVGGEEHTVNRNVILAVVIYIYCLQIGRSAEWSCP